MKPVMDKLRTNYKRKLEVISVDVRKDRENGKEFHRNLQVLVDRRVIEMFVRFGSLILLTNKTKETPHENGRKQLRTGVGVGIGAGYLGGLLGVGGGNFIVPALVWLGFDPRKASATTAFIVIFSSFSGFLGHATTGGVPWRLLAFSAVGSVAGALMGSWLMHRKLNAAQVKKVIAIVLYAIAAKMAWGVIF